MMKKLTIELPEEAVHMAEEAAAVYGCESPGKYLEELIARDAQRVQRKAEFIRQLEAKLDEGIASGFRELDDEFFERLEAIAEGRANP